MLKISQLLVLLSACSLAAHSVFALENNDGNPIAPHIFAADPSAHVWPTHPDTLFVYASHDVPGTNHHASMFDYHVFSTKDGANWIDHGRVLSVDDVPWAVSHAWAIDAAYYNGHYYLIYCMKSIESGLFSTGLAISERPEGPFRDVGSIEGVENGQDPALFIDDDDKPYLYWGYGHHIFGAELTRDLRSVKPNSTIELTNQLQDAFEGPWMNKINGTYFLTYPGLPDGNWPQHMYYATSKSPLGPFKTQGKYMTTFEHQAGTNHGSIVRFKNEWIAFYHSAWHSKGKGQTRSLMADFLDISDGKLPQIVPSTAGISRGKHGVTRIVLEAENGKSAGGLIKGPKIRSSDSGFSGDGYVTSFGNFEQLVGVLVQLAGDQKVKVRLRYASDKPTKVFIMVNEIDINGGYSNSNEIVLPATEGWADIDIGAVSMVAGDNLVSIASRNNPNLKIDRFEFVPEVQ